MYAISAHKSQFFEWIPWVEGYSDEVPNENKQLEWLARMWKQPITDEVRESLKKWYGKDNANKITEAEAFEICEYGRQPTDDEIRQLFPMIG